MGTFSKERINVRINKETNKIITENSIIVKTLKDKKIFVDVILNPAMPHEYLKQTQNESKKFTFINKHNTNKSS